MIRPCDARDLDAICSVINDGAAAYAGVIPADCFYTPYMSREDLARGIREGIRFYAFAQGFGILAVMGIQDVQDVTLIRHAYVRAASQGQGIGTALLVCLAGLTGQPILIGAWADALWAIRFYQHHGFELVSPAEKDRLLTTYWTISPRQVETSVVLADQRWRDRVANAAST